MIVSVIKQKGIFELIYQAFRFVFSKIRTKFAIFFLRMRGYEISTSVSLRGGNYFFQSTKGSIVIKDHVELGYGVKLFTGAKGKIVIEKNVSIYDNTYIDVHTTLSIGENTLIAPFSYIIDYDHKVEKVKERIKKNVYTEKEIKIGKNVWVGAHAIILKGVTIGDNAVVGAGAVVTKDVPPFTVVGGSPARVIKKVK
ncbi:MAG TPA: acyltransferase [Candidatus Saccharimonadales bacterium]|nr:acyltransferase [Candidatus Saccharimonadales bacterium]